MLEAKEIAAMAARNPSVEERSLSCPERCFFYAMKELYQAFRENKITKEQGEEMRQAAEKQFNADCAEYAAAKKILLHHSKMWKGIEQAGSAYRNNRTIENADAFIGAVYGMK